MPTETKTRFRIWIRWGHRRVYCGLNDSYSFDNGVMYIGDKIIEDVKITHTDPPTEDGFRYTGIHKSAPFEVIVNEVKS